MDEKQPGPSVEAIPEGDNRTRLVCPDCGYVEYANPKIVVGAVCTWENRILLCKRAIAPALGRWTIPAGFLELGETTSQGAAREVWEEARARIRIEDFIGIYEIPHISQIYMIYRAPMIGPECAPGDESQEVEMLGMGGDSLGPTGVSQRRMGAPAFPGGRRPVVSHGAFPALTVSRRR